MVPAVALSAPAWRPTDAFRGDKEALRALLVRAHDEPGILSHAADLVKNERREIEKLPHWPLAAAQAMHSHFLIEGQRLLGDARQRLGK